MNKKLFWSIIIILIAVIVGVSIKFDLHTKMYNAFNKPVRQEIPLPNIPIKEYVLGGKVLSVKGDTIKIDVEREFLGPNGNYLAHEEKTVKVSNNTVIYLVQFVNGKYSKQPGKITDIAVGTDISMHSDKNIARMDSFTPNRINVPVK